MDRSELLIVSLLIVVVWTNLVDSAGVPIPYFEVAEKDPALCLKVPTDNLDDITQDTASTACEVKI